MPSTSEPPASTRASLCGQAAPTPGNEPEEVPEEGASKTSAQPESTKKVPPASAGVRGPAAAADNATVAAAAAAAHCEDCDASSSPKGPDDQPNLQGEVEGSDEPPAAAEAATGAAAAAATAAKEDAAAQSTQWGEEQGDSPGQGTVPAGLLWSDFGGGREEGEDAEETASREFAEESFGMFDGVRLDSDSVARSQVWCSTIRKRRLCFVRSSVKKATGLAFVELNRRLPSPCVLRLPRIRVNLALLSHPRTPQCGLFLFSVGRFPRHLPAPIGCALAASLPLNAN